MKARQIKGRERGMALIITMILLSLLGAASLAMVMYVSSDTMINGYYRNYRGSFYAADSGVNAVVQAMKSAISSSANPLASPPLPSGSIPSAVTSALSPYQTSFYIVGDTNSWNGQFKLLANQPVNGVTPAVLGIPVVAQTKNAADANSPGDGDWIYTYTYQFYITVQGESQTAFEGTNATEVETVIESGTIVYTSTPGTAASGGNPSFASWGAFITNFSDCQGPLVQGTMTGPFFTDGQWNFGNYSSPGYTFTDTVGQAGANVSWWNSSCTDSPTAPSGFKQPTFQQGLNLNQAPVVAPTNSYSQAQAVLDAMGTPPCYSSPCSAAPPPSQAQMGAELKTVNGTSYPSSGSAPNGVYLPYFTSATGCATPANHTCYGSYNSSTNTPGAGGGIYIQGDASVTLSATTTSSHPTQTYTIVQGSTTTTIVIDNTAGTTTVSSGGTTQVLTGVPQYLSPTGTTIQNQDTSGAQVNPTLLYVNGNITGLSGTVQNDTAITVAGSSSVSITGDLTYLNAPVSVPSDTLVTSGGGADAGVLGIYTTGNINLYPNSSGSNQGNLTVNATMAALSGQTGSSANSGFETPGNGIGTWQIVGGRAEDHAHSVNISTGNTYFDRRFGTGKLSPPFYPTAVPQPGSGAVPSSASLTVSRASWKEVR